MLHKLNDVETVVLMSKRQTNRGFKPYAPRTYWKNGNKFEEEIPDTADFKKKDQLLSMNN